MLDTSARLLRLLSLLQARRDWTGPQLAERLDVTTRTVRKDVERLRSLGYPVHAAPGIGGGYRLGVGAAVPPLLFDDEEAVAVALALRSAAGATVAGIEDISVRALAKLERLLPPRLRRRVRTLAAATLALPHSGSPVDVDTLTAIAAACSDHERLHFDYQTHDGASGLRVCEPHRLVSSGRRWYLLAWNVDKRDWRTYRVDRIRLSLPAGPRFAPRDLPEGEVTDRLSRGLATAPWRYRARVTVHVPAAEIAGRLPDAITVEPVDEGTCTVDVGSDTPQMLALYLGMLDAEFTIDTVTNPELAEHLDILAARYARAIG
jgi:predicted DNA-binding transcriptional regulator YafY